MEISPCIKWKICKGTIKNKVEEKSRIRYGEKTEIEGNYHIGTCAKKSMARRIKKINIGKLGVIRKLKEITWTKKKKNVEQYLHTCCGK
jgi:hypothetical protein